MIRQPSMEINLSESDVSKGHRFLFEQVRNLQLQSLTVSELFDHYEEVGFLYPEKRRRMAPYMDIIRKNWETARKAKKDILWTIVFKEPESSRMASVSIWRSTNNGWITQHLTSTGFPAGACAMMLHTQAEVSSKNYKSAQNWFQPTNRYANRVFGSVIGTVSEEFASVNLFNFLEVKKPYRNKAYPDAIKIIKCTNTNHNGIYDLTKKIRGKIYAEAEELGEDDIELKGVDEIYRRVGLSRKRYIWMARYNSKPVGAAIAYRGPFGLNFSFIENRCDLLIDPNLNNETAESVCNALIENAARAYFNSDFPLKYPDNVDYIPVMADDRCSDILKRFGAVLIRKYNQSIWLNKGFRAWSQRTEKIFQRVMDRERRIFYKKKKG